MILSFSRLIPAFMFALLMTSNSTNAQSSLKDASGAEVFTVVEDMPIPWLYKSECLEVPTAAKTECYMAKLNEWMSRQLVYPSKAVKEHKEGVVIIRFIVDKSGAVKEAEVLKDIGYGCGQAAINAVLSMPDWVPGRQRGIPVNVSYTIPVKFELKK